MLSLLFIHFNKQNFRTRLLAGISVLAIISFLIIVIFFRAFLYDPLALYASKNTFFYLHLNIDSKGNYYQTKLIDSIINNFDLTDFDRHQFKNELAVVCNQSINDNCYLIFFPRDKKIAEQYFQNKKILYQTPGFKTLIIPLTANNNKILKKSWSPLVYWHYHSGLLKDDLTLVLNQINKPHTINQKLLAFLKPSLRLSGRINNRGIVLKTLSFTATKSDWESDYLDINNPPTDILINLINKSSLSPLLINYFNLISKNNAGSIISLLSDNGFTLYIQKNGNSNDLLNNYKILITSPAKPAGKDLAKIKATISEISGYLLPVEKNIYLNDGTKVTLLNPNNNINSEQTEQSYKSPIGNEKNIYLNTSASGITISNDPGFQPKTSNSNNNYGLIRISSLPNYNPIKQYLNEFSFLYFEENKIIIK